GDWYTSPVAPRDTKAAQVGYASGACPAAEWLSFVTLNLPTHIRMTRKDAEKVVAFLVSHDRT
ncbi:MAG: DegT/DnrJ/EryC1/StrS family aminotransferase, partial [bacterium]|nr:DegT/DnrJ/EryC1/StrS family aminotransferase [bacterium]